jgi:hypothetical protein
MGYTQQIAILMGNMMENRWIFGCKPFSDKPIYLISIDFILFSIRLSN